MTDATRIFTRHRPRLQGIAYRMLGSWAEAEEVVQDAWLRWHEADRERLDSAQLYLATRLRLADRRRSHRGHPCSAQPRQARAHRAGTGMPGECHKPAGPAVLSMQPLNFPTKVIS